MIVDAILAVLIGLLEGLLNVLPEWDYTSWFTNPTTEQNVYSPFGDVPTGNNPMFMLVVTARRWNWFLPIDHLWIMLGILTSWWTCWLGYKVIRFVWGSIRGMGTS